MPRSNCSSRVVRILQADSESAAVLAKELKISRLLSTVLVNRGITDPQDAQLFLRPSLNDFHDPFLFTHMSRAVDFLRRARDSKQTVMIFGDYDADGVCSTALVSEVLKEFGISVITYIPHRVKEGYGLNAQAVAMAIEKKVAIVLTVDCGTASHQEVKELRSAGIEVIVTDHHELHGSQAAQASCLLNPKIPGSGYPFRDLAGVGVAFKLCQALTGQLLREKLDLVALGTIADSVALVGENRIIVKEGLVVIAETKRVGLETIFKRAGVKRESIGTQTVSFILGPRINATGRMDSPDISLRLLLTHDQEEASRLVELMEGFNKNRQQVESKILEEAKAIIERDVNFKDEHVIVVAQEDWHLGVLGIVASKIVDYFYRPAIVISLGDGVCKGSARSIKNFHLFDALEDCKEHLDTFGGHSHAAGLKISRSNIDNFRAHINKVACERIRGEDLLPAIEVDMQVQLNELNESVVRSLEALEPFGMANPKPLFYCSNVSLRAVPQVLKRETLKFWMSDGSATLQAIGFGMASYKESMMSAQKLGVAFFPRIDTWQDINSLILEAEEIFCK